MGLQSSGCTLNTEYSAGVIPNDLRVQRRMKKHPTVVLPSRSYVMDNEGAREKSPPFIDWGIRWYVGDSLHPEDGQV